MIFKLPLTERIWFLLVELFFIFSDKSMRTENNGWKSRERTLDHRKRDLSGWWDICDQEACLILGFLVEKRRLFWGFGDLWSTEASFPERTAADEAQGLDVGNSSAEWASWSVSERWEVRGEISFFPSCFTVGSRI